MAQPCPPGSHRLAREADRETDCNSKGSTKAPTPCPRPRPPIPTHGLPQLCLCPLSRARRISPGRRRSLPRKMEGEAVFAQSSQPSLGGCCQHILPEAVTSPLPHFKSGLHIPQNLFWGVLPKPPPLLTPPQTKLCVCVCVGGSGVRGVFPQHRAHLDGPAPQTGGKVRMP